MRIERDTQRGRPFSIRVDGHRVDTFEGETIAAAMLQHDAAIRRGPTERRRGLYCNMGSCGECMVTLVGSGRRVRACLTPVADGLEVATDG
jgi:sarcosine oxidase subunit alpha